MVKVCSAILVRPGKTVSDTVCCQKVAGSVASKLSLNASFPCRSISTSCRGPACAHLNVCVTSFENPLTSLIEKELLPKAEAVKPFTEVSNQLVRSTLGETSFSP